MPDMTLDPTTSDSSAKVENVADANSVATASTDSTNTEATQPTEGKADGEPAPNDTASAVDAPAADASEPGLATSSSPSTGADSSFDGAATDPASFGQAQPFNPPTTSAEAADPLAPAPAAEEPDAGAAAPNSTDAKPADAAEAAIPAGGDANLPVGSATVTPSDASAMPDPTKPAEPLTNGVQPGQEDAPPAPAADAAPAVTSSTDSTPAATDGNQAAPSAGLGGPDAGVPVTNPVNIKPDVADTDATIPVNGSTDAGQTAPLGYPVASDNPPAHPATMQPMDGDIAAPAANGGGSSAAQGGAGQAAGAGIDPATLTAPTATTLPDVYTKLTDDGAKLAADLDELADDAGKVLALDLAAAGNLAARINTTLDLVLAHGGKAARKNDAIRDLKSAFDLVQDTISPLVEKVGTDDQAADGESLADKAKSAMSGIEKVIKSVFAKLKG